MLPEGTGRGKPNKVGLHLGNKIPRPEPGHLPTVDLGKKEPQQPFVEESPLEVERDDPIPIVERQVVHGGGAVWDYGTSADSVHKDIDGIEPADYGVDHVLDLLAFQHETEALADMIKGY